LHSRHGHADAGPAEDRTVDAAGYLRESILAPNAFIAPNCPTDTCFKNIMPQDFGTKLSEQQIADLVAFLLNQQ